MQRLDETDVAVGDAVNYVCRVGTVLAFAGKVVPGVLDRTLGGGRTLVAPAYVVRDEVSPWA